MTSTNLGPQARPTPIRVWLEPDLDSQPIEGGLSPPGDPPRPFSGWLGLTAALERLRASRKDVNQRGSA